VSPPETKMCLIAPSIDGRVNVDWYDRLVAGDHHQPLKDKAVALLDVETHGGAVLCKV
jgi:hypothetical protein